MNRREVVAEFYEILQGLREKQGGFKLLDIPGEDRMAGAWRLFLFRRREFREDGSTPRVMRIGKRIVSRRGSAASF
jgi:hypothetical protein